MSKKILLIIICILFSCLIYYYYQDCYYRLGDVIYRKATDNLFNRTLYSIKWKNTIADQYYKKKKKYQDYETLYQIVKNKSKKVKIPDGIPDGKTLVIHLRIGDVIENEYLGSIDDLLEGKSDYKGSDGWYYLKDYKYFENNIEKIKDKINKIVIVGGYHCANNPIRSKIYLEKLINFMQKKNYIIEQRIDKYSSDEDFIYMSNSSYFLRSGGGYSKLANEMVKMNNKYNLIENYDDNYEDRSSCK